MRLIFLTVVVMIAFAANSVLGRWAIGGGHMEAMPFGLLRLGSGAAMLALLCWGQGLRPWGGDGEDMGRSLAGGASLLLYIVGFSIAYVALDAGLGALILFGAVQMTMFAWGVVRGDHPTPAQWGGAVVALAGLAYVVWPAGGALEGATEDPVGAVPLWAAGLMAAGGVGWGIYSLVGRGARTALVATMVNFSLASLVLVPVVILVGSAPVTGLGVVLAVLSGAVTSALGYALWYRILPQIPGPVAATVQLSVPVIAILAGSVILGEPIGTRLVLGTVAVLGGIALVILDRTRV